MPATDLAPDVRARLRERRRAGQPAPTRPPAGRARPATRFGSVRLPARHHWVLESALVVAAIVLLVVLLLG